MIVAKNGHSDHHWHAGSNLPKAPKVTTKGVFLDCLMNTPGRCPLRVCSWKSCSTVNLFLAFAWHPMSFKKETPVVIQAVTQLVPRSLEVAMPTLPKGTHVFIVLEDGTNRKTEPLFLGKWEISLFRNWKLSDGNMPGFVQCFFTCHPNFRWF